MGNAAQGDLRKLAVIADRIAEHRGEIEALYVDIVKLVRRASSKGASRRAVATAAGMSAARVQQIIDGIDLASKHREEVKR